jgi:integrase/recombinase XerC
MINSFLKYLEFEKRYSPHTLTSYRNDLNHFTVFLQQTAYQVQPEDAEHQHIRGWLIQMVQAGMSPASINRKIATLRSYYKYGLRNQLIDSDPSSKVKMLKGDKSLPVFAKERELTDALDRMVYIEGFEGKRDQLVMEILYGTGTRLSELINLLVSDIDLHMKQVKVLGKRNKQRIIPLPTSLVPLISKYQEIKRNEFVDNYSPHLIVNNKGRQAYPMLIYRIVNKALKSVPSLEKQSPHILRHTFATHLLNKGAELNAVKELLGHASLAATQVYTHNSIERLKEVFNQSHPKA